MTENSKPKSAVSVLMSKVDNIKNDSALLRQRVDNLEKVVSEVKEYIKDQFLELYSQLEAARETMDEISSFIESLNEEEDETPGDLLEDDDFGLEQELEGENEVLSLELDSPESDDLLGEDGYPEDHTADEHYYIPSDNDQEEADVS
jgi:uncharacterized coiled-coil DUF342 family protein